MEAIMRWVIKVFVVAILVAGVAGCDGKSDSHKDHKTSQNP
jgi:predicted small lipoprotein YifL